MLILMGFGWMWTLCSVGFVGGGLGCFVLDVS